MTNNKKLISLIFFIFIILTLITIWIVIYSLDNNRLTPFADGTEVGYVYIGGRNTSQAEGDLRAAINKWKSSDNPIDKPKIKLSFQDYAYQIEIEPSVFTFNVSKSIQNVHNGQKMNYDEGINVIDVEFEEEYENWIKNEVLSETAQNILKFREFDFEIIKKEVLKNVSFLFPEIYVDLGIGVNSSVSKATLINEVKLNYPNFTQEEGARFRSKIERYFKEFLEITPKSKFSFNDLLIGNEEEKIVGIYNLEENKLTRTNIKDFNIIENKYFNPTELNVIATGIFKTILKTNFKNIEKHKSLELPSFLSIDDVGFEAITEIGYDFETDEVLNENTKQIETFITGVKFSNNKDLTFWNPNYHSYYIKIETQVENNNYVIAFQLYGTPFIYTYDYYRKVGEKNGKPVEVELIERPNSNTYPGYHTVLYRTVKYNESDDPIVIDKFEDTYMPKDHE